jgi:hypothetical protein
MYVCMYLWKQAGLVRTRILQIVCKHDESQDMTSTKTDPHTIYGASNTDADIVGVGVNFFLYLE